MLSHNPLFTHMLISCLFDVDSCQAKFKVCRSAQTVYARIIQGALPPNNYFPLDPYRALQRAAGLAATPCVIAVEFCAGAVLLTRQVTESQVLCDKPTVYYGPDVNKSNCACCMRERKPHCKRTFLIPLATHVRVSKILTYITRNTALIPC
jgi:hypothetical protein